MVIQSSWSKITNFVRMHRKTRSAQITSLRPQWTAARWFSRVKTQYSALVAAVRREIVQWSFNRACAEQSVRRDKPRPNNSASLRAAFGVRSSSAETNNAKRSGEHLIARAALRACTWCVSAIRTLLCARIVRKCEIGKSRVLRAVTFPHVATYGWFARSIFRMRNGERNIRLGLWGKISDRFDESVTVYLESLALV